MKILVVDVAGEGGGALSVLERFVEKFKADSSNEYIVCIGNLEYDDCDNVKFLKLPWVKKSRLHRLFFDMCYVKKLVKKHKPSEVFSLQNKGFNLSKLKEVVYFHNALFICEKRFSFNESRLMWLYQNVIAMLTKSSLKNVDKIIVQAEWIKNGLARKWNIDPMKIFVDSPDVDSIFKETVDASKYTNVNNLFYPAAFYPYKNHLTLLRACASLWDAGYKFTVSFTGDSDALPNNCKRILNGKKYPIEFLGRLTPKEMRNEYERSVLVFPSYIETVGLPLAEARSMGIRILAADCEYAHEVVGEYENVTYFAPLRADLLEKAIVDAIK